VACASYPLRCSREARLALGRCDPGNCTTGRPSCYSTSPESDCAPSKLVGIGASAGGIDALDQSSRHFAQTFATILGRHSNSGRRASLLPKSGRATERFNKTAEDGEQAKNAPCCTSLARQGISSSKKRMRTAAHQPRDLGKTQQTAVDRSSAAPHSLTVPDAIGVILRAHWTMGDEGAAGHQTTGGLTDSAGPR